MPAADSARPVSPWLITLPVAVWLTTVGNLPLWQRLADLGGAGLKASLAAPVLAVLVALLSLLAWPRVGRVVASVLVVTSAATSYFMATYGVVIDSSMIANALATDAREVRDLLSWSMPLWLVGVAAPPLWWIWRRPVAWRPWPRQTLRNGGAALLALLVAVAAVLAGYQQLASLARDHKPVRYLINPFNSVYALGRLGVSHLPRQAAALQPVGTDARLPDPAPSGPPPLFVVVVGETARAQNWGLNGYARPTTPSLARWQTERGLVNFPQASSCGTNTQVSVPCLFSPLGRAGGGDQPAVHENLLDVLQRAGLAVLWVDNQSGCKGVCARVPSARPLHQPALCEGEECFDEALLTGLDAQLAALDPQRLARGTVLVLHLMGSHGPAYFKRTPAERKPFRPECTRITLAECDPASLTNAYDNTIAYTDHVLDRTLQWLDGLARRGEAATGLYFVSDHGESLGEKGLYLHGVPYAFAPEQQTRVPMVVWQSEALQRRTGVGTDCLRQRAALPVSHDHLFHSVLGALAVQTSARQPALDLFRPCGG